MRDFRDAKAMAQTLREMLKTKSITLSHSESLELIAKTLGFHDWNVLSAAIQATDTMPAATATPPLPSSGHGSPLPIVPLRDIVVFPQMVAPLFVGREKTKQAVEAALSGDGRILAITQRRSADDDPGRTDLYPMGVTANVIRRLPLSDGTLKLIVSGVQRAAIVKTVAAEFPAAEVTIIEDINEDLTVDTVALSHQVLAGYEAYANAPAARFQSYVAHPGMLADAIAPMLQLLSIGIEKMQQLLETNDVVKRLELILELMKAGKQAV
jgi:ATP-dependent Lon protease